MNELLQLAQFLTESDATTRLAKIESNQRILTEQVIAQEQALQSGHDCVFILVIGLIACFVCLVIVSAASAWEVQKLQRRIATVEHRERRHYG
jgi:CHASE3 domain sensor protein